MAEIAWRCWRPPSRPGTEGPRPCDGAHGRRLHVPRLGRPEPGATFVGRDVVRCGFAQLFAPGDGPRRRPRGTRAARRHRLRGDPVGDCASPRPTARTSKSGAATSSSAKVTGSGSRTPTTLESWALGDPACPLRSPSRSLWGASALDTPPPTSRWSEKRATSAFPSACPTRGSEVDTPLGGQPSDSGGRASRVCVGRAAGRTSAGVTWGPARPFCAFTARPTESRVPQVQATKPTQVDIGCHPLGFSASSALCARCRWVVGGSFE